MLRQDVLTPDVVEDVIARAIELHTSEPDEHAERRERLASEAKRVQEQCARLTDAIRMGGPLGSLVEALGTAERDRADVNAQLEHLDGLTRGAASWGQDVRSEIRRRLSDWSALIGRQPAVARQVLRKVIDGRLTMTPRVTPEGRWYEASGRASYGRLFAEITRVQGMVPPG